MALLMNLNERLSHRCSVTAPAGNDQYGQPIDGTTTNSVSCFAYGNSRRMIGRDGREVQINYTVLFLPTASVDEGYEVNNLYDNSGNQIIKSARVVDIAKHAHWSAGMQVIQAFATRSA